jgi:phosphomannomutase
MSTINPSIFKEYDVRGKYPQEIDEQTAYLLGKAFVISEKAKKIVVASDRREESKAVLPAFIKGATDAGAKILDLGINSTPSMFFAVMNKKLDGGVAATASHNPKGYTGLKICNKNGTLFGLHTGLKKIAKIANSLEAPELKSLKNKKNKPLDVAENYFKFVSKIVEPKSISGFKLVLDASNGSGARLIDHIFIRLHSKITKMNFSLGDQFEDHGLNPMLAKNRKLAKKVVKQKKADMGLIFDGDGDRCIFISDTGDFVHPYYINCLLAKIILAKHKRAKIVIDARLPIGISQVIKNAGGKPLISRSGYSNVVILMQKEKALFGCENSGHYFINAKMANNKKSYIFGDAIIPALLILKYLKENDLSLSEATDEFKTLYPISGEMNFKDVDFEKIAKKLEKKYTEYKIDKLDGISIYNKNISINVRPSKTEPLVRVNIEAKNQKDIKGIVKDIKALIK